MVYVHYAETAFIDNRSSKVFVVLSAVVVAGSLARYALAGALKKFTVFRTPPPHVLAGALKQLTVFGPQVGTIKESVLWTQVGTISVVWAQVGTI